MRPTLATKGEVIIEMRALRAEMRRKSPIVKAKDLALALDDGFLFTVNLDTLLRIEALTDIARDIVQEERARSRSGAAAGAEASARAAGTAEFPQFAEICSECPSNYAVPGEDDPADTVYVETFEHDFGKLPAGFNYLRKHARAAERNAAALQRLYRLCRQLKGRPGETPRAILARRGFDPGDD